LATWLKPGLQYDLIVDLSRYAYSEDSGTSLSSEAREQILNNRERKSVRFVVRPFSFDGKLRLKASEDVLRAPIPQLIQPSTDEDLARIAKLRKGEISIPELAHDDAAHFKVTPMARGCAAIGVSVWDESGLVPVDHFVISVPIAENGKHIPSCGNNRQARVAVEKGTSSFLRLSLERGPPEPEPVASLHIFEAEVLEKTRTAVFMVEGGTYKESAGRKGLYVWVTETLLTDYMTTPLWTQIDEARRNVQAKRSYGYAQVAQEFALKLFSGSTEGQRKAAKKARNALRSAVAVSANPTVVVRMVTRSGDHLLIPLALLGARAQDPIVTKPLTVVEPLMIERYSANQPCIAAWTLAIPKKLSGVDDVEMEAALRGIEKLSDFTAVLKTQQELISYVSDPKPEGTAEGLILLAHHDQGYLWFDNVSSRLSTEMLTRRFAPGIPSCKRSFTDIPMNWRSDGPLALAAWQVSTSSIAARFNGSLTRKDI
jgi:hypothetical protein